MKTSLILCVVGLFGVVFGKSDYGNAPSCECNCGCAPEVSISESCCDEKPPQHPAPTAPVTPLGCVEPPCMTPEPYNDNDTFCPPFDQHKLLNDHVEYDVCFGLSEKAVTWEWAHSDMTTPCQQDIIYLMSQEELDEIRGYLARICRPICHVYWAAGYFNGTRWRHSNQDLGGWLVEQLPDAVEGDCLAVNHMGMVVAVPCDEPNYTLCSFS